MSQQPSDNPDARLDPRRLLEMALETMADRPRPRTPPPDAAALEAALPRFEILGLIGQGGMGSVFKARERKLGRVVALKVLPRELLPDPAFEERFLREARAQAALNHPNILTIHDYGESDDFFYIVSEYVDGVDLRQLMRMERLSPVEALRLVPQMCDALQFAHQRGVVHRDIKPENILIDQDGTVRIADFGLAKLVGADGGGFTLTRTEQALGTPHYMAPEQMQGAAGVDHRADIYALGVVIYEMLTGQLPIGRFALPSEKAGTRKELDEVVLRALAQAVEDRYQSAGEVKSDVQSAARMGPAPARSRAAAGGSRLGRRPVLGLVVLLVAVVGAAVVMVLAKLGAEQRADYHRQLRAYEANQAAVAAHQRTSTDPWPGPHLKRPADLAQSMADGAFVWPFVFAAILVVGLIVSILGFSGIGAIRRAPGELHGLGLAVLVAWLPLLALVDMLALAPLGMIRDHDTWAVATPVLLILVVVLDVVFLHWQYRRHRHALAQSAAPAR